MREWLQLCHLPFLTDGPSIIGVVFHKNYEYDSSARFPCYVMVIKKAKVTPVVNVLINGRKNVVQGFIARRMANRN